MKIDLPLHYQLRVYLSKTEKRTGVCSDIEQSDKHILLWDLDGTKIRAITKSLRTVQLIYKLSDIYIIASSPYSYHAYCFTAVDLKQAIHILSATKGIDLAYLRLGMVRGYYTLRITPRKNEEFKLIKVLHSEYRPNVNPKTVTVNEYWTTNIKTGVYKNGKT